MQNGGEMVEGGKVVENHGNRRNCGNSGNCGGVVPIGPTKTSLLSPVTVPASNLQPLNLL